ncbi:hypothetical protein [Mycobacterium sp. 852002-50816_SCH5313054-b]|uniref:hypothetical protein n=1 Tax=Mycobacterium sp. 852002-50816_SCH5313054-b TaxID=1834092 RepID=UPI001E3215C2|nr:hypothetical protein [Mycobacterium sp. 852002-50816_SCH5313054-b]
MTMKLRMVNKKDAKLLEATLADHRLPLAAAERIHGRVGEAPDSGTSRFASMKKLLGIADRDSTSLEYSSLLWPEFDFKATSAKDGRLESARYWHVRGHLPGVDSPAELPTWSTDVTEFAAHFGPLRGGHQRPLFDDLLPGHEWYEFLWNGERYGAEFSWGLFLYSAELWE